ncbi:hypothetical protein ACFLY6_01045 [Candidatus Dependentiae bacterium]
MVLRVVHPSKVKAQKLFWQQDFLCIDRAEKIFFLQMVDFYWSRLIKFVLDCRSTVDEAAFG